MKGLDVTVSDLVKTHGHHTLEAVKKVPSNWFRLILDNHGKVTEIFFFYIVVEIVGYTLCAGNRPQNLWLC